MRKIIKYLFCLFLSFCFCKIFAQEVKTSLLKNVQLTDCNSPKNTNESLKKAGSNFPFIDYFIYDGIPKINSWINSGTEILSRRVVFNAINSSLALYTDPLLPVDVLTSKVIDLTGLSLPVFISFTINSGVTFTPGDSIIFEGRDNFGTWQPLWRSEGSLLVNQEVIFTLNQQFISTGFEMRWKAFTSTLTFNNNQIFLLSKVVLSQTLPFPWYENIKQVVVKDSTTLPYFFSSPDVKAFDSSFQNSPWGNSLKLDGFDALNQAYINGSASYGGADTLYLNPFNVLQFAAGDSIIFSFAVRGINGLQPSDSLLVEFKNNLGKWIRTFSFAGANSSDFKYHLFNINRGRNRHANLQVRFVFITTYAASNKAAWLISGFRINRKIEMPFLDDFSVSIKQVDPLKWADKNVYVNNDFPVNHPSINVATFDGLDERGNAYSPFALKGTGDVLTSHSFNLQNLNKSDSLILSFYYQYEPQGTTGQVFPDDSLLLELRASRYDKDYYKTVWMMNAKDSFNGTFQRYDYILLDSQFFHDDFQFRFKIHGSLSGNLSQWHLDYVRFNKGRKVNDAYYDVALTNTPAIMLGKYRSMPWKQYIANSSLYTNGSDSIRIANHDASAHLLNYFRNVIKPEGDTLSRFVNVLGNLPSQSDITLNVGQAFTFSTALSNDSLVFANKYRVTLGAVATDNITTNDTFTVPVVFSNYYAYDDGTAEGGYGIQFKTNSAVSLRYTLDVPDSLYGLYIFFNQSEKNVSTQRFNIKVWEKISPLFQPASSDKVIYSQEVTKPVYTNTINGFAAFRFPQPIAVRDSFYVGWDQVNAFVLNVGLDKNYPFGVNNNMAYKIDGRWYPSEIPGALMIRPVIGKFIDLPSSLVNSEKNIVGNVVIYPNPAKNEFVIDHEMASFYDISLYDLTGRKIEDLANNSGRVNLPVVPDGLYILVLQHKINKSHIVKKLMINQN
ncbi:MAG: T9SS type A sorting domain-containing protein [Bacteroidia bacterium]|nr:T9SS type A sorting domain-containing protein [Bacteroidia bacterium]